MDVILRAIKAVQTVDANKAVTPAILPKNELIDDHLIIPPANTNQEVKKRNILFPYIFLSINSVKAWKNFISQIIIRI